jgi:hypothetical protein
VVFGKRRDLIEKKNQPFLLMMVFPDLQSDQKCVSQKTIPKN